MRKQRERSPWSATQGSPGTPSRSHATAAATSRFPTLTSHFLGGARQRRLTRMTDGETATAAAGEAPVFGLSAPTWTENQPGHRGGDLLAHVQGRGAPCWVYVTMYLNACQRTTFYEGIDLNTEEFDMHVIIENRMRGNGHGIAAARMDAKINAAGWISDQMGGVSLLSVL